MRTVFHMPTAYFIYGQLLIGAEGQIMYMHHG